MSRWLWTAELWTPVAASDRQYNKDGTRGHRPQRAGGAGRLTDCLQERLQLLGAGRMPQLAQGLRLDLPDPLPCDVKGAADLLERVLGALPDPETHLQDLLLPGRQGLQHAARLVLEVGDEHGFDRRENATVLDEVAQ